MIASGQDLDALREQVRPKLRAALAAATRKLERTGQTTWTFGTIPKAVALPGHRPDRPRLPVTRRRGRDRRPARARERRGAAAAHAVGMRRLLALTIPSPLRSYQRKLGNQAALALMEAPHESVSAVLEDAATAAIRR